MSELSIIIPAYNEAEELPNTLGSLREALALAGLNGEIIVVDNNSTDATAEIARANGADRVVFEPMNQIARARNAGAKGASTQFLVFIDADTRISGRLLDESLNQLKHGDVGGGSVIRFEGEINWVGRLGISLWERVSKLTQTAAGSFIFCRRDAFEAIGGFDEKLYAGEEVRFSRQMKKWGREENRGFSILTDAPAQTSARKLQWYSGPKILGWMIFMMIFPVAVRWRRLCGFWYRRPESECS